MRHTRNVLTTFRESCGNVSQFLDRAKPPFQGQGGVLLCRELNETEEQFIFFSSLLFFGLFLFFLSQFVIASHFRLSCKCK